MNYLALCCIVKDEDNFIEEWLTYHSLLGVEHFFIYDNMSVKPLLQHPVLKKYIEHGKVTISVANGYGLQMPVYQHCMENFGNLFKWIGFIDLDEFICPATYGDLRAFLPEFEDYGGLALNWRTMGSSGHINRPEGLVIENYTEYLPNAVMNMQLKSIVQPSKVSKVKNPHTWFYNPGEYCVNAEHFPVPHDQAYTLPTFKRICLNHYYYRSQQDYAEKILKGRASCTPEQGQKNYSYFYSQFGYKTRKNHTIRRFAADIKTWMEKQELPCQAPEPEDKSLQGYLNLSAKMVGEGKLEAAETALAHAGLKYSDKALLWVMRGNIARNKHEFERSRRFLYKALSLDELPQIYEELIYLHLATGERNEAASLLFYLQNTPSMQVSAPAYQDKLAILSKQLQQ